MSLDNEMDDETWYREAQKRAAKEKAAAADIVADLDRKPDEPPQREQPPQRQQPSDLQRPHRPANVSSSSAAYVPPGWSAPAPCDNERQPKGSSSLPLCGFDVFTPPTDRSFDIFFKDWFANVHFPAMSELLKAELVNRAREKGFFSGISSQFKKWAMANTDPRLQCDVWFSYFNQNRSPQYSSYGPFRTAVVNLGADSKPFMVTFYGYPDDSGGTWFLRPFSEHLGDMGAILEDLDGQGGLTAFLSAAGSVATAGDDED
jgi:hypothetical protein